MGTDFSTIICQYAMVEIADPRLDEELAANPAAFFRKMSLYMQNAIPRFNRPPEIRQWLQFTPPRFGDYRWTAPEQSEQPQVVDTGMIGFELFNCGVVCVNRTGAPIYTPYTEAQYNKETGEVTFPAWLDEGAVFEMDFYTDGTFEQELTYEMQRILGLCVQYIWETRFVGDWLDRTPKVTDKSFSTPNEANATRANTERIKFLRGQLDDEIISFEHNLAYQQTVGPTYQLKFPAKS